MGAMASQIISFTIVYSTVYSDADQRKHQSSASLAFMPGIHRWPVNSPRKWPVTRKMFPFDDVIMLPRTRVVQVARGHDLRYWGWQTLDRNRPWYGIHHNTTLNHAGHKTPLFKTGSWWRHQIETFSASLTFGGGGGGEFTGHRWIPLAKASEAGLWCFLWSAPEQTVEQTFETPVILDATALIMTSQIYTVAIMKSTVTMKVFAKNYPLNMSETSPGYNHQYSGGGCWGWWVGVGWWGVGIMVYVRSDIPPPAYRHKVLHQHWWIYLSKQEKNGLALPDISQLEWKM